MKNKSIAFKTLGCRLNQYETDAIASEFHAAGYNVVDFQAEADAYIINSCTVTQQGEAKSRKMMHQAIKHEGKSLVVVTGCMVNNHKEYREKYPDVTYFIDNERKTSIFSLVDAHFKGEIVSLDSLKEDVFSYKPAKDTFHTRSFIKVQDGCDNFCTFCIIPMVRGRAVSRPASEILENVRQVLDFGYKEIVITGVNIGRYESDGVNFEELTRRILEIPGDFRVRITSLEPDGIGDGFFELFKNPKLAPHMHLCLQSGSDRILMKMRRMYSLGEFLDIVNKIRKVRADFNFTTDILVGFPGETEADFQESCKVASDLGFSHIHTFKYSIRQGTRAERMSEQVADEVKAERSEIIRQISDNNKMRFMQSMLGKSQKLLIETVANGSAKGYGEHYLPIIIKGNAYTRNEMIKVRLDAVTGAKEPLFAGTVIPE